jgi:DNA-binding beta-propeller fold protein YncE
MGSTIYVADSGNDRIQVFSTRGKFIRIFAKPAGDEYPFDLPSDVALAHGRVFVSEFHGKKVQVLTPFGDMLQVLKLPGVGSLSSIDVDTVRGIIYVADHDHHRVHAVAVRGAENYTSTLPSSSPQAGANAGLNPGGRKQKPKQRNINRRKKRTGRGGA